MSDTIELTPRQRKAPADAIPFVFSDSGGNLYEGYVVNVNHGDTYDCIAWGGFDYIEGVEYVTGYPYDEDEARVLPDAEVIRIPSADVDWIEVF